MVYNSNYSGQRVDELLDKIDKDNVGTVDSKITEKSQNPVTSEAIFKAFKETDGKLTELESNIVNIIINGNGNIYVSKYLNLTAGRTYRLNVINPDWQFSIVDNKFKISYKLDGVSNTLLTGRQVKSSYEINAIECDNNNRYTISIKADEGEKAIFFLEDTTDSLFLKDSIIQCLKNDGVTITKNSDGYQVKIAQIRVKTLRGVVYIGSSETYQFGTSNSFLVVDASDMGYKLVTNVADISSNDIVLLSFTKDFGFTGGILYDEFVASELAKTIRADYLTIGDNVVFDGNNVSWGDLKIKVGSVMYDLKEASFKLNAPLLVFRRSLYVNTTDSYSSGVQALGSVSQMKDEDIVLAYYRNSKYVDGCLVPYYYAYTEGSSKDILDCAVYANNIIFNHNTVKWDSMTIRVGSKSYGIPSHEFTFGAPLLIFRPTTGEVMQLGAITQVTDGDIFLLVYRDYKFVDGKLLGYYNAQLRDTPKDAVHLNVYKKAYQQKNLKWTPKVEVVANEGTHPAGVEVIGVPYSSAKEELKLVGKNVSIHTFMTAVNNVYSLLYTERISKENSKSSYGKVYHGTNCISYFGSVCSSYNSDMLGIVPLLPSWGFRKKMNDFSLLPNQNEQLVEVGDILVEPGHVITCIKIEKDEVGNTQYLTLAEQAAPIKIEKMTPLQVRNRRNMLGGVWVRYDKLYNNTQYTPSPFILVDNEYLYEVSDVVFVDDQNASGTNTYYRCYKSNSDSSFDAANWRQINVFSNSTQYSYGDYCINTINGETNVYKKLGSDFTPREWNDNDWEKVSCNEWASVPFTYNDDIVTYAGDRACFGMNDNVYINYNIGNYTSLELFKEDALIKTLSLSGGYQVDVTSYLNGSGKYRARLKNGSTYSRFTYFELIDNRINASFENDRLSIKSNINPICFALCPQNGGFLYNEEVDSKDIVKTKEQLFACMASYSNDGFVNDNNSLYCRLIFQGEYGQVPSEMIYLLPSYNTGDWLFVEADEQKSFGELVGETNVAIVGDLNKHSYVFDVYTELSDTTSVNVVPIKGSIKWAKRLPNTLKAGYIYQVSVVNGIGNYVSNED